MAAPSVETPFSFDLPLPSSVAKNHFKPISVLAPCATFEGTEKIYAEGSVFELESDTRVLTVFKRSPDQQRVTAINKVFINKDPEADEIWVVPDQPGKEDRSKRFRVTFDNYLRVDLFDGKELHVEYNIHTGERRELEGESYDETVPNILPKRAVEDVVTTMATLVLNQPLELTTIQAFINFPRDNKLEAF
jgi:hypothetical protein